MFTLVFSRLLGRRWGAVAALLGIILYTILVGASPSVLRAAIMGGFALFARQLGRRTGINTLGITAGVMAVDNPNVLWDPGFQLSFAATLGLVLYAAPLQGWLTDLLAHRLPLATARRVARPAGSYFLFTLAALGLVTVVVWRAVFTAPDGRLHVTILDVSDGAVSGDGILVRTPTGRNILIDGGPSVRRLADALGRRLPFTDRGLDWLVVAAPGDENMTSLPQVLDRFRPADVLWAGPTHGTYVFEHRP